jgi:mono/diheme cytochrome c family protein
MKKILKRVAIGLALFLVLGVSGLAIAVKLRENRTFDAPYPTVTASKDPAVIERGRYLATGIAHCTSCHGDPEQVAAGALEPRLSGGMMFDIPPGQFFVPNITPDEKTGIGRYTDAQLARALRFGVRHDGRAMLPFMPFANLADDDLVAVLSYLRAQPAVEHAVPEHDPNLLGRFAKAFILEPHGPTKPIVASMKPDDTAAYGEYLANSVGNCFGCHTQHDMKTGAVIGKPFAGGSEVEEHGKTFYPPNLTPDPETGRITQWTEEQFVARFQHAVATDSPMPWATFSRINENDLRALYRYLHTLPAVVNKTKENHPVVK